MARTNKRSASPQTTAQSLGSLLKSARDIMRKDKGLNGDLDRLPLLTWAMFLKFLDDLEFQREEEAILAGKKFRPAIDPPYRWRDWAADHDGVTGDDLLAFVNQEKSTRPDGTEGLGLFAYLRSLTSANGDDRRDVIATVFRGVDNRMRSGYLLRDVINTVDSIHFTSSDELQTLGTLYESLLREMRDAAGDSGEFYTPRPVVRFMVKATDPRLGETVLDPATGTGGFLVEALAHLQEQVHTVEDQHLIQQQSIYGCEPKSLPYLLAQMNLLLHGLDSPQIDPGNALRFKITEIGERDRVDVILTNPPFGGEEERGIQGNFPEDKQTSETALLFLQLIMRKLRRSQTAAGRSARAAVIVPDGVLSGRGVAARIRQELLRDFHLHTVVRLPSGVFAPYTTIPANILFFDRAGPTQSVWYYEVPLPEGRKAYSKTAPLDFSILEPILSWWNSRLESPSSWLVTAEDIASEDFNLDIKNPSVATEDHLRQLRDVVAGISSAMKTLSAEAGRFAERATWARLDAARENPGWKRARLQDVLLESSNEERVEPDSEYTLVGVRLAGAGAFAREVKRGAEISATRLNKLRAGDFIYSRLFAWRGAFGIVPESLDGSYVSNEFPSYQVVGEDILPEYLRLYFSRPTVWRAVEKKCEGTTKGSRNRFKEEYLMEMEISYPPVDIQRDAISAAKESKLLLGQLQLTLEELQLIPLNVCAALYQGEL